jgi:FMN phosphatase YigB (HAD superfamily)
MAAPATPVVTRSAVAPRGVILDVDGTMYAQAPVRARMAWRLARAAAARPREGVRWWRVLRAYREAQEALRVEGCTSAADDQLRRAVERSGVPADEARACVERWMHGEPCALLARHRRRGLPDFLRAARAAGVRVGVFSDYPCERKLDAMGVRRLVDAVRSAHDPEVGRFKPEPAGLLAVAGALGVAPRDCVYVGDRPAVDAAAATAAGMRAVIVAARRAPRGAAWESVPDFVALADRLGFPAPAVRRPPAPSPHTAESSL